MAESEPKPRLIELVAPGAGQGWKAVLKNGKPAVIHEIPVPGAEAAAAIPRIQRLADHRHPALSPVLAWGTDPNGIWVAVEPNEGTPLSTILSRGPLTPPAAAALGTAVLSGVAALHEAGVAMGGFGASAIRVTGNGEVRLAGHPAAAVRGAPAQSDLRADVRSCGMAVCAAFGVDPAGAPAPPNIPPGLVVTMRSMASGAMGPAADRAQAALREMASAMLAPDRMVAAQSELALRAGGREMPSVTPFLPKEQAAAPAPPPPAPAPPPAPIPTPYVPPVPRDETPIRAPVSYDAPPRAMQTYPAIPAPTFTAPPEPPAPAPAPPEQEPTPSPVPTWSEAPPRAPSYETPAAAATTTNPPAPAQEEAPPAPPPFVPLTRSSFESAAPAASSTNPPMAAPPAAPPPAPPARPAPEPAQQTWTPMETPVWKPGGAAPAAEMSPAAPVAPPPEAPPLRAPISAPARKPTVARRPAGGGTSNRPSWLVPAIIAVVLILLLGTAGGIILARNNSNSGPVGQTSPSPGATTSPRTSPNATPSAQGGPRAVPTYAPVSADPVKSLQYCSPSTPCNISGQPPETATSCDLGAACHVEVAIAFSSPQRTAVGFSLKFFDRCTGVTTDLPGPNPFTPPGYTLVILDKNVTLPTGVKSGALVAVSTTPAVAASPALLLGSTTSCA
ncbi:MAG TPA: hypothetical protein VES90_03080 [Candidatus Eisenbacteria bacterium]|nr:hypothetical protein [Candidatus Eisenbacteria bacterium]